MSNWNYSFNKLDNYFKEKFKDQLEFLGKYPYKNFYPFKSPKGKWMAFHSKYYSDIRIVDLENPERIVYEGYYRDPNSKYSAHCNVNTYVPSYLVVPPNDSTQYGFAISDNDFDDWLSDGSMKESQFENIDFLPLAFNVWTIWAADYELYLDVFDLSKIDDGILNCYKTDFKNTFPIECSDIRKHIKVEVEEWFPIKNQDESIEDFDKRLKDEPFDISFAIKYLPEVWNQRFEFPSDKRTRDFYNMYTQETFKFKTKDEVLK